MRAPLACPPLKCKRVFVVGTARRVRLCPSYKVLRDEVKSVRDPKLYSSTACSGAIDCLRRAALLEPIISASGIAHSVMIITIW
jgi:hypothetical protein